MAAKTKQDFKLLTANIDEAIRQLDEIPVEQWKDIDFENHPKLTESEGLLFSVAKSVILTGIEVKKREKKRNKILSSKWETPGMVVAEKELMEATDFLLKLHPDTQKAALNILASNIEEGKKSQSGGVK